MYTLTRSCTVPRWSLKPLSHTKHGTFKFQRPISTSGKTLPLELDVSSSWRRHVSRQYGTETATSLHKQQPHEEVQPRIVYTAKVGQSLSMAESHNFAGFRAWRLARPHDVSLSPAKDSTEDASEAAPVSSSNHRTTTRRYDEIWPTSPTSLRPSRKIDLSYWNVIEGELRGVFPEEQDTHHTDTFRGEPGASSRRYPTKIFMQRWYPSTSAEHGISDHSGQELLNFLRERTADKAILLQDAVDYMTWSWVLLADYDHMPKRLVALSQSRAEAGDSPVPQWVLQQVLRVPVMTGKSFNHLRTYLLPQLATWKWQGDSLLLLIIRLLRHARVTYVPSFKAIIQSFTSGLDRLQLDADHRGMRKMSHWCNRMLTLLSLPAHYAPFEAVPFQQSAQLELVRYMQDHEPQIPLLREGYRAIAKVQLMHAKTEEEKDWAKAKAFTWPPWEPKHQMGAPYRPKHYPGKISRVMKVLRRMKESGYAPYDFDSAIEVMTGWDTDGSPTIQLRRTSLLINVRRPWTPGKRQIVPNVWAARVDATRTLREAWMCFCAYRADPRKSQSSNVYHAMFKKLFATPISRLSETMPLPGDGLHTYPDPELDRDKVYISEPIPSVESLFSTMIESGIRPSTKLISDLLRHTRSLRRGLTIISHSNLNKATKDILLNPHLVSPHIMAGVFQQLHPAFLRAYMSLVARPHVWSEEPCAPRLPGSFDRWAGAGLMLTVLTTMRSRDISVWNDLLHSLQNQAEPEERFWHHLPSSGIWALTQKVLAALWESSTPNFVTFKAVAYVARVVQASDSMSSCKNIEIISTLKHLFMTAATGSSSCNPNDWTRYCRERPVGATLNSMPSRDALHNMLWALATSPSQTATADILDLLHWICGYHNCMYADGQAISRHTLAAFRALLENYWWDGYPDLTDLRRPMTVDEGKQTAILAASMQEWPDDDYMEQWMVWHEAVFKKMRQNLKDISQR